MAEYSAPVSRPHADRRRQSRLPVRGLAIVCGPRLRLIADTVDISAHGVCLSLPTALDVGGTYRLDLEIKSPTSRTKSVVARVCFCLKENSGYRIGLNCLLEDFVDKGVV
jgi:hypothetical protein